MAIGDEVDYYLECAVCGDRSDFEAGGVVPDAFYFLHGKHPDEIKIVKRTTTMPASLNLRDVKNTDDPLSALMARHPDWAIEYSLEAGYKRSFVRVEIRAQNKLGTFELGGKATQDQLDGLLFEMEGKMLTVLGAGKVRANEWNVKREFADVTTFGSDERVRVATNTEYSAFVEYGAPARAPRENAKGILDQAMEKAAQVLKADIVNGTIFGTGKMLDSIAAGEKREKQKIERSRLEKILPKAERDALRMGNWEMSEVGDSYVDAVDAIRFQLASGNLLTTKITRAMFDRLDVDSKMSYVRAGGKVFDVLPSDDVEPDQIRAVDVNRFKRDVNARINERQAKKERNEQLERLQRNIERAAEVARQQKLKEAMDLLRQNGIAVNPTVALNAGGNANPSSPQQPTTAAFEDKSKPRRRIRLAKQ